MKKIFAALISLTLLCSCGTGQADETETTVPAAETTYAQMQRTEQNTETTSQTADTVMTAVQMETEYGDYEYQPPQEILNTHFYSDDIEAKIECEPILDDDFRDVFNDSEDINKVYKAISDILPKEIVDNIYNNIQPSDDCYRIKNVSYMKYDLNSDGNEDYYLYADVTDSTLSVTGNVHFERIFIADGSSFKPINIPSFNDNRISCYYILSTQTNGVKDIFAFHNSNKPSLKYDGVSTYGGAVEMDEMHTFFNGEILPGNILHLNMNISVIGAEAGEYYTAIKFADNKYIKNNMLYTCHPDGTPRTYNKKPHGEHNDFSPAIQGYDFYAELTDNGAAAFAEEDVIWQLLLDLLEIKYIPAETSSAAETTVTELITKESGYCAFDGAELLPESEVIAIAEQVRDGFKQSDLIKDYAEIDDMGVPFDGSYDIMIVPAGVDFEEYCSDEKNFPMYYEDEYENGVLEKLGENDLYSQWRNAYTEIRRMYQNDVPTVLELDREYRRVFLKNFVRNENNAFSYTGKMTAEDIMRNFDIFTRSNVEIKICRRVAENSDSFTYEFYSARIVGGDWGLNDEAVIEGRSVEISKADGSFNSEGTTFYRAGYEIPGTAPDMDWEWDD